MKAGILLAARWAVLPLLLFSPGQLDFRPQGSARDSAPGAIIAILDEQQAAWNRGDVVGFMNGYWKSPQLTFAGSGGITRGWQNVQERYRKNYPDARAMGHLDFSALEVHPLGRDAALVLGRWHLERTSGELGGVFTLVFQRLPEGWRIVHDHTSADEKP